MTDARRKLSELFGGRCAYCGKLLGDRWHADHVEPIYRGNPRLARDASGMVPACPRCNIRKGVLTVEEFRAEIEAQVERLRRDSAAYRLAEDYGMVEDTDRGATFWFERCNKEGE